MFNVENWFVKCFKAWKKAIFVFNITCDKKMDLFGASQITNNARRTRFIGHSFWSRYIRYLLRYEKYFIEYVTHIILIYYGWVKYKQEF